METLTVIEREGLGSSAATKLRAQGLIPVNFYGPSGNRHLSVSETDFRIFWKKVKGTTSLFEIEDDKKARTRCLIQEVQFDTIKQKAIHVDIREIAKGVEINANVVVKTTGEAFGVKNEGGVIEIVSNEIEVKCLPRNLPNEIMVDVTDLHLHQGAHIKDLPAYEGVSYVGDPDQLVVSCAGSGKASAVAEEETEEEEESTEA